MPRFDDCLAHVLKFEGGFSNRAEDRGGATNRGVTQSVYDDFRTTQGSVLRSVRDIHPDEVSAIYRDLYWKKCACDVMAPPLDMAVFDAAVQHGPGRAVKWLQAAIGVAIDGICGNQTLFALNGYLLHYKMPQLIDEYMQTRAAFYLQIVARDASQQVFAKGWANRLKALRAELS